MKAKSLCVSCRDSNKFCPLGLFDDSKIKPVETNTKACNNYHKRRRA
jgi:hypothetical protein